MPKKCPPYTLKTGEITQSYTSVVTTNPKRKQYSNRHTKFSNKTGGRCIAWYVKNHRRPKHASLTRVIAHFGQKSRKVIIPVPPTDRHIPFWFFSIENAIYYDSLKLSAHWEGEGSEQTSLSNLKIRLGVQFGEICQEACGFSSLP